MPQITQFKFTAKDKNLSISLVGPRPRYESISVGIIAPLTASAFADQNCVSASQFADKAGITPQAVRKMISEGRLKAFKVGQQHVIKREDLVRYLEEG